MSQISWHVPDAAEIDLAIRILKEIVEPELVEAEKLVTRDAELKMSSRDWATGFSKRCNVIRQVWVSAAGLTTPVPAEERGNPCSDAG